MPIGIDKQPVQFPKCRIMPRLLSTSACCCQTDSTRSKIPPNSVALLPLPLLLPAWKPRRLVQCVVLPIFRYQPLFHLLLFIYFKCGHTHMLHMPGILIFHHVLLTLFQNLSYDGRNEGLVSELLYRRKQRLEVENDCTR